MKTTMKNMKEKMNTKINIIYVACAVYAFAYFPLSPPARAVSPPPDGGYPGGNTAEGDNALFNLTSGTFNTAIGIEALFKNQGGIWNTATGSGALHENTSGQKNTAYGVNALFNNTTGTNNTSNGVEALRINTTGSYNTAVGMNALYSNTTGSDNTATGWGALERNTIGYFNVAAGYQALDHNMSGVGNAANGTFALITNRTGHYNTANGSYALYSNTSGGENTAIGDSALYYTTGSHNIGLGESAGALLTFGDYNIDIGNEGVAGEGRKIRIGTVGTQTATFIAGIRGATVAGGIGVIVGNNGQLGTVVSSARFKEAIKPMDKVSEAILALEPVTFRYKHELDPDGIPQFGLIAEQVEKVNPDLVARDADGKVNTVRYEAVNAMLLNEFLKAHRRIEEQDKRIDQLTAQLNEQASLIQKVSAQLEVSKPAPQTVLNNR
jgi:hypothetical protein